jgi:release factor glutamine methyltransferase
MRTAPAPTVKESIVGAADRLRRADSSSPRLDAELLLAEALGVRREALYAAPERVLDAQEQARFEGFIRRRERREPVAYIVGRKAFRALDLRVNPSTLIPRPETETLVEAALAQLPAGRVRPTVLDIGTGSGAVALALADEHPSVRVVATESEPAALETARLNAARLGLSDRVEFVLGDLYDGLPPGALFQVIVSNPPYVTPQELETLAPEVRDWEPHRALLGGEGGLDYYQRIVPVAPTFLVPGGFLAVEVAEERAEEVRGLFEAARSFEEIAVVKDLGGKPRVVVGRERPVA